ncbi:MAG: NTP transferase domain-containing protein [Clostridia bacterium]|nr:NTP transferase domain-containing protein [Clostridia bacterium]
MVGLILAAGKGARLSPGSPGTVIKPLAEAGGSPLISYSFGILRSLGIKNAVVVIRRGHEKIADSLGPVYMGTNVRYVVQDEPTGLVSSMAAAKDLIDGDVLLQLSDEVFLNPTVDARLFEGCDFAVGYTLDSEERIRRNFSVEVSGDGVLLGCEEKPKHVFNDMKGTGLCYFSKECFDLLQELIDTSGNAPKDLCDFFSLLISRGKIGRAFLAAEEEINVNTPEELSYADRRIRESGARL